MTAPMVSVGCTICAGTMLAHLCCLPSGERVSICRDCGFVFLSRRHDESWYRSYYSTGDYDKIRPLASGAAESICCRISRCCASSGLRVLDIGCGAGGVLSEFARSGMSSALYGIEPSAACSGLLKGLDVKMVADRVEDDWSDAGSFDVVIMRHVLEHLCDPVAVLARARKALSKRGRLYIAVPDTFAPAPPPYTPPHLSYFSMETLLRTCASSGLVPVEMGVEPEGIWGIFERGKVSTKFQNVYDDQMRILNMSREDRRKAKQEVGRLSVIKTIGLEIGRLDADPNAEQALCVQIRLSRNNHTNTASVNTHGTLDATGLHLLRTVLGYEEPVKARKPRSKTSGKGK